MFRLIYLASISFLFLFVACNSNKKQTISKEQLENGQVAYTPDLKRGEVLFKTCVACHGDQAQGNVLLNAPCIANQEAYYMKHQLANFKKGIRGANPDDLPGTQMAAIAKGLKDSTEIADVVAYIKTLPSSVPALTMKGNVKAGEDKYKMICGSCHGPGATGIEELNSPKLVGLNDWYLHRQIMNFKNGLRGTHADDLYGAQMLSMVATLKDEQAVNDVVAYIQTLEVQK